MLATIMVLPFLRCWCSLLSCCPCRSVQYFVDATLTDWNLATWSMITTQGAVGVAGRWMSPQYTNHREQLTGYLVVPRTGTYQLYVTGDDSAALYLAPSMFVSDVVSIANASSSVSWLWYWGAPSQISAPIGLTAGTPYYFKLQHTQFNGTGHARVAIRFVGVPGTWCGPVPP